LELGFAAALRFGLGKFGAPAQAAAADGDPQAVAAF
jgi:hypothetical protein